MAVVTDSIAIHAGATVELGPGGLLAMFGGLTARVKRGGTIAGALVFEKAGRAEVAFRVESMGQQVHRSRKLTEEMKMHIAKGLSLAFALTFAGTAHAEELIQATLYKMPWCECCEGHAEYLREQGFAVEIEVVDDLTPLRRAEGVPEALEGCHTILVGGYVVEGHVSADSIRRLLSEHPDGVIGIAMTGMPTGVPGMPGEREGPVDVYAFGPDREPSVFATE